MNNAEGFYNVVAQKSPCNFLPLKLPKTTDSMLECPSSIRPLSLTWIGSDTKGDAKPELIKALVMQGWMWCGSLNQWHLQKLQMIMKRTRNNHKQNQEILSWFYDRDHLWPPSMTGSKLICTKPSRLYPHDFLKVSRLLHNSYHSKDQRILRSLWWSHR